MAEERFQEIAALQAELAEAKACIANQAAQITGKHQYVGQDFKFRMDRLQAENAELRKDAERIKRIAQESTIRMQARGFYMPEDYHDLVAAMKGDG